jgi:uncharacterized membrane protein
MIPVQHIHPMLVHFPIVFFLSAALFDIVATFSGRSVTGRSRAGTVSLVLVLLAALSAVATFFFGGMALDVAESGGFHSDIAEIHEGLGTMTTAVFVMWAVIRSYTYWRDMRGRGAIRAAAPVFEIFGVVLVTLTAYFGGELVYGLGVNVAHAAAGGG